MNSNDKRIIRHIMQEVHAGGFQCCSRFGRQGTDELNEVQAGGGLRGWVPGCLEFFCEFRRNDLVAKPNHFGLGIGGGNGDEQIDEE